MEVIMIACCVRKAEGGTLKYKDSSLQSGLSAKSYQWLLDMRKELAEKLPITKKANPGPDLGSSASVSIQYLPAYQRYTGIVYQRGQVQKLYPQAMDRKLLIISALYGMLDAFDLIRNYDLTMNDILTDGKCVQTWWKQNYLGCMVEEYIMAVKPTIVHDLLPLAYRNALGNWSPKSLIFARIAIKQYNFPGQGIGALWRRGDEVEKLLLKTG
jgi:cytoplasmic iron level regulating protein YaaA (DUF328/UPF0246 family)